MKKPADMMYMEKKVWAKKQDSWKVGITAAENMASVRLQYTNKNKMAYTSKKSCALIFSPAMKYTGIQYTATKNVWKGISLTIWKKKNRKLFNQWLQ